MIIAEVEGNTYCEAIGVTTSTSSCTSTDDILKTITCISDKSAIYDSLHIDYTSNMPDITILRLDDILHSGNTRSSEYTQNTEHEDNINMMRIRELNIDLLIINLTGDRLIKLSNKYPLSTLAKHVIVMLKPLPNNSGAYDKLSSSEKRLYMRHGSPPFRIYGAITYYGHYNIENTTSFTLATLVAKVRSITIAMLYEYVNQIGAYSKTVELGSLTRGTKECNVMISQSRDIHGFTV